jgi:biopolymer transport protein TolR
MPKVMPAGASGHGGAGRRRRPRVAATLSEINVVPLVDVMLVLLIIFMVAAPMMQQGLAVNLPTQRHGPQVPEEQRPIYVTVPIGFGKNRRVQIGEEAPIPIDVLTERIRQRLEGRDSKQVFLRSDGQVTMQQVMDVMDKLKAGGVDKVGILSRPPGELH